MRVKADPALMAKEKRHPEIRGEESRRYAANNKAGTLLMHSAVRRRELYGGRLRAPGESI